MDLGPASRKQAGSITSPVIVMAVPDSRPAFVFARGVVAWCSCPVAGAGAALALGDSVLAAVPDSFEVLFCAAAYPPKLASAAIRRGAIARDVRRVVMCRAPSCAPVC